jgi:hypothetical protein
MGSAAMRARLLLPFLGAAAALAALYACSSNDEIIEVPAPKCPDNVPLALGDGGASDGAADAGDITKCDVPETKTCGEYVGTGADCEPKTYTAKCVAKKWVVTPGAIKEPGCPTTIPAQGQSCPACFNAATNCTYSFRCNGVQTPNAFSAQCLSGAWKVTRNTTCLVGDAGTD